MRALNCSNFWRVSVVSVLLVLMCLAIQFMVPPESDASTLGLPISGSGTLGSDFGILIPGLDLSSLQLPLLTPSTTPSPGQPATGSSADPAADAGGGYGGYANGYQGASDLPGGLGAADAGLATGGINSEGGIVPDWAATPQDESEATAAGIVEPAGVRFAGIPLSIGSAGSAAPPAAGIAGGTTDLAIPGFGTIRIGGYSTQSSSSQTSNDMSVLHFGIDALGLDMQIPVGRSTSDVSRTGNRVESSSSTSLIDLETGDTILGQASSSDGAAGLVLLEAESSSNADGASAGNEIAWELAGLKAAGIPFLAIDGENGVLLAGIKVIPAAGENKSLLAVDQLEGLAGVYVGETWSETDGKSYAFGGVNILRVSVLGTPSFVVLGHAGSGANAVSATGPGAGPDQVNEGPPGSNIPPAEVSPPNDQPLTPVDRENPIGPGPDPKPNPNPEPEPLTPGGPPALTNTPSPGGPGVEPDPGFNWSVLPNTGVDIRIILAAAAALFMLITHGYRPAMDRLKNRAD